MRKITHSKKGFTLLEMMLSIAIITIVSGCLYTLVVAVKDSYLSTYNTDDSVDYAMLYARAFENDFLARTQEEGTYNKNDKITWYSGVESGVASLYRKEVTGSATTITPIFTMTMNKVYSTSHTTVDKWKVQMTYSVSGAMVNYEIKVIDNYYDPGVVRCVYEGGFWIPHGKDIGNNGTAKAVDFNGVTAGGLEFKFTK